MSGEELSIKLLLRHSVMALEVVSRGDPVPDAAGCRVLCQTWLNEGNFVAIRKGQRSADHKNVGVEEGPG